MSSSKKVYALLILTLIAITLVMISLLKKGVTLRLEPLIKPTVIDSNFEPVARHLFLRLFPDFQDADYIIWSFDTESEETELFKIRIKSEFESKINKKLSFYDFSLEKPQNDLDLCSKPCWIYSKSQQDAEIIEQTMRAKQNNYRVIYGIHYTEVPEVSEACLSQSRLEYKCIPPIALNDVKKKLKDNSARYFFLKKYLDLHFYLFIKN